MLSEGLKALGAEPVEVPVLEIRPPEGYEELDRAVQNLHNYDWLILTSANTVHTLAERSGVLKVSLSMPGQQVAVVGKATAEAAGKAGFIVTLVPESYVAESLVEALMGKVKNKKVLLARAAVARDVIPDALRAAGAVLDIVDAYRNFLPETAPSLLRDALTRQIDAATFTSSSSVTHLAEAARLAEVTWPFPKVPAVSIGPITSQSLRELHWEPSAEASPSDVPGLIAAVRQLLDRS
jgi:uroporphyrinogen-III synthase